MKAPVTTGGGEPARARLLAAATAEFARRGYAATTVREIVAAAGVTKPVLYYHFGSKEGIFLALLEAAVREFEAVVSAALASGGSARRRIERLLEDVFALLLGNLEAVRVIDSIFYGPPQGAPFFDFERVHRHLSEAVLGLVREGMDAGEYRAGDPESTTLAILGVLDVARGLSLCHPEANFDVGRLHAVLDVVFRGVLAAPAKEPLQ